MNGKKMTLILLMSRKIYRSIYRRTGIIMVLCFMPVAVCLSAGKSYCFRIYLKDKGAASVETNAPEAFLSPESIERRMLREVYVDETDIPVSRACIDELTAVGVTPVLQSKWMKTVVVESSDSAVVEKLQALPFVDSLKCVWNGVDRQTFLSWDEDDTTRFTSLDAPLASPYGYAENQIELLNGLRLHDSGYRGRGVRVAVIDAGFMNVDRIDAFSSINLLGTLNVTFPGRSVFRDDNHGTKVLSCMAANLPGVMTGTAPDASFLLIKSEDTRGEYPVEEDFWVAAVEYADSVGVDIISSSLGYFRYDHAVGYYSRSDLDGQTAFISRAAGIAAKKGILIVCSAGNEGNDEWEKITFPADVPDVLTVGSITSDKEKSSFSSVGMTADYRIKPDVVALGTKVSVIGSAGQVQSLNGTSFSAPTVAGLAACLWQAFPLLKNTELIKLIKESSSQHQQPDAQLGYGIPDMFNAYKKANNDVLQNL
jgi:subtilisin family serine protease